MKKFAITEKNCKLLYKYKFWINTTWVQLKPTRILLSY